MSTQIEKICQNHCPNCGAGPEHIEWRGIENDDPPYMEATCKKCGCEFAEIYEYSYTEYTKRETTPNKEEIVIRVSDGMVQNIDIPDSLKNTVVIVKDYDTDGADDEDVQEDEVGKYYLTRYGE